MRNREMIRAFRLIAEGFSTLANAYEMEETTTTNNNVEPVKEDKKEVVETPVRKVKEEKPQAKEVVETKEETTEGTYTYDSLEAMSYNELKTLAKDLGVKAIGTKKIIIDSILAHLGAEPTPVNDTVDEVATDDEVAEIEESTDDEVEVVEEDSNEDDEEVEVEEETTLYDQIVTDLEGYSDEELADILSSVGVSPKGKRQALLAKIVQAIEEGVLEWEDEESTDEEVDVKEVDETPSEKEETFLGTKARKIACEKEEKAIEKAIEQGEISHKELIKYLKDFNNGQYVSQGEDGDVEEYISIQLDLIDDEGVKHELADPYYIGDDVLCCGQRLNEVDNDLYCKVCGTTYEV